MKVEIPTRRKAPTGKVHEMAEFGVKTLCGIDLPEPWNWTDEQTDCKRCLAKEAEKPTSDDCGYDMVIYPARLIKRLADALEASLEENELLKKELLPGGSMFEAIVEIGIKRDTADTQLAEAVEILRWINSEETDWENGEGSIAANGFRDRARDFLTKIEGS